MFFKYIFRLIHIGTFGFYSGLFLNEFIINYYNSNLDNVFLTLIPKKLFIILGLFLAISGLINLIILIKENKYVKDYNLKIWKYILYFKLFLFLQLTPLLEKIALPVLFKYNLESFDNNEKLYSTSIYKIKALVFLLALIVSPYARFHREKYLTKLKTD